MSNKAKGYVVRGEDERGYRVTPYGLNGGKARTDDRGRPVHVFTIVGDAVRAHAKMLDEGCADVRIFAVAEAGTETPLPSYEEALVTHQRAREVLDDIARQMRGMSLRGGMYGSPCCVEALARSLMFLRRVLLGAEPDAHPGPGQPVGVYDRLLKERFKTSVTPAFCHLRDPDEHTAHGLFSDFLGEWWKREQEAVPDRERDVRVEEERLSASRARVVALAPSAREEGRKRMRVSWDRPDYAVKDGCRVDGDEVVWPDGERWPISAGACGGATS